MKTLTLESTVTLNDGRTMPLFGLGVFQMQDKAECIRAIHTALEAGYRHIDTAVGYNNEDAVGDALAEASVPREEIFLTSKVPANQASAEGTRTCVEESLRKLRTDFIDLYLIHWPIRGGGTEESYETLQALREEGKLRSIGVSNFTRRRFEEQFFKRVGEVPAVNQIERHPYCANADTVAYCRERGIQVEAYSPLARKAALEDPVLQAIANSHSKSTAQIMLRWQLQQGIVVIPKSVTPARIRENAALYDFELTAEEMARIDGLNREETIISWRPEPNWF
ncbi:MAG: aldo/keto reductase [Puniceicoccaceae bacterium]|nr:MAG: aldo/keto reductase [Puniceicoccaceae bacterium]